MAGLPKLREVAARFSPSDNMNNIQKPAKSPHCPLGEVTQSSESRLSETSGAYHLLSRGTHNHRARDTLSRRTHDVHIHVEHINTSTKDMMNTSTKDRIKTHLPKTGGTHQPKTG